MPLEAVVGEDAAQVRMIGEEHAVHVPDLALEPDGRVVEPADRGYLTVLAGRNLDPDPQVMLVGQQVVDDLEALFALRVVDPGDVAELLELAVLVVPQERQQPDQRIRSRMDDQLAVGGLDLSNLGREGGGGVVA